MHHSWWKLTSFHSEYSTTHLIIKSYTQWWIKEMLRCSLSICLVILVWESSHIIGQEVPRFRFSMILLYLHWQEFTLYPEFSNIWCRHSFSRGMRHSTYILSRALLIFALTLIINHFKMLMIGAMGAWNQWISCLKHKLTMKHLEARYYFTHV
jgi:hypothetical protein